MSTKSGVETDLNHIKERCEKMTNIGKEHSDYIDAAITLYIGGKIEPEQLIDLVTSSNNEIHYSLDEIKYLIVQFPKPKQ
jgi:hypothetical protein